MDSLIGAGVFVSSLGVAYYLYASGSAKVEKNRHDAYNRAVDNYMARRNELVNSLSSQGRSLSDINKNIEDLMGNDFPTIDDFD